jgi:hypothetical protein
LPTYSFIAIATSFGCIKKRPLTPQAAQRGLKLSKLLDNQTDGTSNRFLIAYTRLICKEYTDPLILTLFLSGISAANHQGEAYPPK